MDYRIELLDAVKRNLLFRNTPAMPTGIHLVVALLAYPLMWGPVFLAQHTRGRKLTEYGFGLNVKALAGAAVTAIFLLAWPWSDNSVAKSLLEAYARTSEELLFRGFLIGECFLQAFFPESCKPFFHSIASPFSTKLQVPFPHRN